MLQNTVFSIRDRFHDPMPPQHQRTSSKTVLKTMEQSSPCLRAMEIWVSDISSPVILCLVRAKSLTLFEKQ
jgi:hypothetical protein